MIAATEMPFTSARDPDPTAGASERHLDCIAAIDRRNHVTRASDDYNTHTAVGTGACRVGTAGDCCGRCGSPRVIRSQRPGALDRSADSGRHAGSRPARHRGRRRIDRARTRSWIMRWTSTPVRFQMRPWDRCFDRPQWCRSRISRGSPPHDPSDIELCKPRTKREIENGGRF